MLKLGGRISKGHVADPATLAHRPVLSFPTGAAPLYITHVKPL
jgi:hypothetical protein